MVGYLKIFLRLGGVYNFFLGGGGAAKNFNLYFWRMEVTKQQAAMIKTCLKTVGLSVKHMSQDSRG